MLLLDHKPLKLPQQAAAAAAAAAARSATWTATGATAGPDSDVAQIATDT